MELFIFLMASKPKKPKTAEVKRTRKPPTRFTYDHAMPYTGCCKTTGKLWKYITETLYGVFFVFLGSYDCQIWAIFHFGTLWAYGWKKSWKIWPWKKARFQGWLKLADFMVVEFWGLPTLASIISGISSSISKIFVPIVLQIFWIFQSIPITLHFDDFEGSYDQKSEN